MDRLETAEVFIAIAERGSLTAAAEGLDISRAMVTRHLAQMEAWAGTRLLQRSTRRNALTPAGDEALARCREMVEIARRVTALASASGPLGVGLLRVSCSQAMGQSVLAEAIAAYLARQRAVSIDLVVDNRIVNLIEERVDLAVRIASVVDPGLIARRLGTCASVLCAAPGYLRQRGMPSTPQDLLRHDCLTYNYFGKSTWSLTRRQTGEPASVQVAGRLSANESVVLLAAALQGAGIALQPKVSVAPLLAEGRLVEVLPDYRAMELGIHAVYVSRRQMSTALRSLLDFLVAWFSRVQVKALIGP